MRAILLLTCLLTLGSCTYSLPVNWPETRPSPFFKSPDGIQQTVDAELDPAEQELRKYFHEPSHTLNLEGHYDARFFQGVVNYEERLDTLRHLIRSYLRAMESLQAPTWLAHGTLLGWQWNKQTLPWDWDLDVQLAEHTLESLVQRNLNGSVHSYHWTPGNRVSRLWRFRQRIDRDYLLDISPHSVERNRGDAMNVIDARWIDTRNGLFIDITAIAETHPDQQPGVWACKNYHRYYSSQIWPLQEDTFEGVRALVPQRPVDLLREEYGPDSLKTTEWEDHRWHPRERQWIRSQYWGFERPEPATSMEDWRRL